MAYNPKPSEPMFTSLHYCTRCGMPSTEPEADFDSLGICVTCTSLEQKMQIDWTKREENLRVILDRYRGKGPYDCIVPISGGKDSAFQLHKLVKEYGLRVLTITFSHNWFSEVGQRNLNWCLETFGVDHIQYTPS